MSIGVVAFLLAVTIFVAVYAWKAPSRPVRTEESHNHRLSAITVDADASGLFERIILPVIRNVIPQTPMAVQARAHNSSRSAELLVKSGNPWNVQPEELVGIRVFAAMLGLCGGLFLAIIGFGLLPFAGWIVAGGVLGWFAPRVLLDRAKGKRLKEARRGLPEAVDLLVITMKSGKRIDSALEEVHTQIADSVIRAELGRVVSDLNAGRALEAALTDMARRAPTYEVESFARAVIICERMGSDVTETLTAQATSAREAYEQMLDAKIGKLSTTLFFPLLAFMIPSLFIVMLAPAVSNVGDAFSY